VSSRDARRAWVMTTALALAGCEMFRGAFTRPEDLVVDRPAEAVAAARVMIEEQRKDPERHRGFLWPAALPEPLRVQGLRYAHVHRDHVDLVLARNPDVELGARIWAADHRPHADEATRYGDIHFFRYSNDALERPDNIP
jgi:hypothetical protein